MTQVLYHFKITSWKGGGGCQHGGEDWRQDIATNMMVSVKASILIHIKATGSAMSSQKTLGVFFQHWYQDLAYTLYMEGCLFNFLKCIFRKLKTHFDIERSILDSVSLIVIIRT